MADKAPPKSIVYFWLDKMLYITTEADRAMRYHQSVPCRILSLGLNGPIKVSTRRDDSDGDVYAYSVLHDVNTDWGEQFADDVVCNLLIDPASSLNQTVVEQMTQVKHGVATTLQNEKEVLAHFRRIYHEGLSQNHAADIIQSCYGQKGIEHWHASELDPRVLQAVEILRSDLSRSLSTEIIAQKVGISESRLFYLFKHNLGISMSRYILWRRFFRVSQLLLEEKSLLRAALMVGFWDAAHMSNTFKGVIGAPPSQLLKTVIKSKFLYAISKNK